MRVNIPSEHLVSPLAYLADNMAPQIVRAGLAFAAETFRSSKLSFREFEAARVRTAQINGCMVCRSFRPARKSPSLVRDRGRAPSESVISRGPAPDEDFYAALNADRLPENLSDRELLAIEFADGMGLAPQSVAIDEAFWVRMKVAFSDEEIVDLTFCLAEWIGLGRMAHVLGLDTVAWPPRRGLALQLADMPSEGSG